MTIETKELVISEELKRKEEMICRFAYVDYEFINGNIKSIKNTNIAYVKPHILKVKNNDYLVFEEYDEIFVNGYEKKIKFKDLEEYKKEHDKRMETMRDDRKKTFKQFVYEDLGYTKEQVLHATLRLDEKTPHIHYVVVPLIRKYDKRTNTEKYSISKK